MSRATLVALAAVAGCASDSDGAGARTDDQTGGDGSADTASAGAAGADGGDASAGAAGTAGAGGSSGAGAAGGWGGTVAGASGTAAAGGAIHDAPYDGPMCGTNGVPEVPFPTGYELPSYDGGTDGLCDPADSIGCYCTEFPMPTVECAPDGTVCAETDLCQGGPPRCGWIDCDEPGMVPEKCKTMTAALEEAWQRGYQRACASDLHCHSDQTCSLRLGDRMFCWPPQFGSDGGSR